MAKKVMKFTGERAIPLDDATPGNVMVEHLARYQLATGMVAGKDVLDVACGTGYGTYALAASANSVLGADISAEAIEYAKAHYQHSRADFKQFDMLKMPLADKAFDIVVSFETIEHVADGSAFLRECCRVLRDDGKLVISVPLGDADGNQYHLAHYQDNEVKELLSRHFNTVSVKYQRGEVFNDGCCTVGGFVGEYLLAICEGVDASAKSEVEDFILEAGSDNLMAFGGKYEGGAHCQQVVDEMAMLICYLQESRSSIDSYLEIGSAAGGSALVINHFFAPSDIVLVDDNKHHKASLRPVVLSGVKRTEVIGNSTDKTVAEQVIRSDAYVDLLFIDGSHRYEDMASDVALYSDAVKHGGFVALHDSAYASGGGPRLVEEMKCMKSFKFCQEFLSAKPHNETCGLALFQKL